MLEAEENPDRLRVLWIGSLGLIRLVGSVLNEIERENVGAAPAIDKHWAKLQAGRKAQNPAIFWKFIKGDRDRALHRYEVDLYPESSIPLLISDEAGATISVLDDCLFVPLEDDEWRGDEAGGDARDAYSDAIGWWESELSEIERDI